MKVVINKCYGGFGLSSKAVARLYELRGLSCTDAVDNSFFDINRTDPNLIKVVQELGKEANGSYSKLKIVTIPDDVDYEIEEYDGMEWIAEKHRTWG